VIINWDPKHWCLHYITTDPKSCISVQGFHFKLPYIFFTLREGRPLSAQPHLMKMGEVHALVEDFLDLDKLDWNLFRGRLEDFIL